MTCDKIYSLAQLFNMALRPDDAGNLIVDTVQTDVVDACVPFDVCDPSPLRIQTLLVQLFQQRDVNCWAVRVNVRSVNHCDPYFTCDNADETWEMALRKSITAGTDGKPVLNIAEMGDLTKIQCDDFKSFLKALFWANETCVAVRGGAGGSFTECAAFNCDAIPGGWRTALQRAIGITEDNCPAFFFGSSEAVPDCGIPDLMAAFFECATPYFLVADPTGNVDMNAIHFLWEQSTDNSTWTFVAEGDGLASAQFLEFTNPQFMRVTMSCEGYTLSRTMDIQNLFATQSWSLYHFLKKSINNGSQSVLDPTDVFWLSEGDALDFINNNPSVLGSTYTAGAFHAGPDRNMTKATVDNQTLYEEVGSVAITDDLTFPGDGCEISFNYEVHFVPIPLISGLTLDCSFPITLEANYGANASELYTTYQWYKNGALIVGETNKTYDAVADGDYSVQITHHGITLDSANHTIAPPASPPQPTIELDLAGHDYYFNGSKYFLRSTDAGLNMTVVDTGPYAGGYPPGTVFNFYGVGATLYQTGGSNVYFNATLSDEFYVEVLVAGQCPVTSDVVVVDFTTVQQAQLCDTVEEITACTGSDPNPPIDANCGWYLLDDHCSIDGFATYQRSVANCFDLSCNDLGPDFPIINVTDNGNGTWTLDTTGFGSICGKDFTANPTWVVVAGPGTITGTGLSVVVDSPGVYGFKGGVGTCTGVAGDLVALGSFNVFIN